MRLIIVIIIIIIKNVPEESGYRPPAWQAFVGDVKGEFAGTPSSRAHRALSRAYSPFPFNQVL